MKLGPAVTPGRPMLLCRRPPVRPPSLPGELWPPGISANLFWPKSGVRRAGSKGRARGDRPLRAPRAFAKRTTTFHAASRLIEPRQVHKTAPAAARRRPGRRGPTPGAARGRPVRRRIKKEQERRSRRTYSSSRSVLFNIDAQVSDFPVQQSSRQAGALANTRRLPGYTVNNARPTISSTSFEIPGAILDGKPPSARGSDPRCQAVFQARRRSAPNRHFKVYQAAHRP